MKSRGSDGGRHGAAGGASSGPSGDRLNHDGRDREGKLRIHLKRSCTDRKLVQGETGLGLTTDDWQKFKKLLASKTFAVHDTKRIRGVDLTVEWAEGNGFREPVIALNKAGMGIEVPDSSFTVADVARVVGEDKAIRPIHVGEQATIDQSMTLAEFAEYFETCTKPGQAILNMISLEFSDTPLAKMVQSPQLVRDIDWLNRCWPPDRKQEGQFPKVQYYCLMSQGGSYTDFHVDFGGTSVWYHILWGKKEFLLIRPTKKNLELYESWIRSPTQSQVFFGDVADLCYRVVLNAGETLMIPSGWIHAVFTPEPSLVFGGNFLHSLNIPMQLQVHAIETRAKIQDKFRFPYFKEMMLFAASSLLSSLREQQGELETIPSAGEASIDGPASSPTSGARTMPEEGTARQESGQEEVPRTKEAVGAGVTAVRKNGTEYGSGVSLGSWEREGLRPLLEACRAWVQEEDDAPQEWQLAATAAGCVNVNVMLAELGRRVSALGEITTGTNAATESSFPGTLVAADAPSDDVDGCSNVSATGSSAGVSSGEVNGTEQAAPSGAAASGTAALLLAAAAAATLEKDAGGGTEATPKLTVVVPDSNDGLAHLTALAEGDNGGAGDQGGRGVGGGLRKNPIPAQGPPSAVSSPYAIPKLKLSIKPPHQSSSTAPTSGGATARANGRGPADDTKKVGTGLKVVLKGPAIPPAAGDASAGGSSEGGGRSGDSAGKKRRRQPQQRQEQRHERQWKEDYEDSDEFEARDDSNDYDDDNEEEGEEAEEEEEEDSGDETLVGRGGKRKARPLGSRLRAIARLGDDAAAGDSEDDNSAEEYKPDDGDDDVLPEDDTIDHDDHDDLPRKSKKGKAGSAAGGGGAGGGARASGTGARGKLGVPMGSVAVIGGVQRRLSMTKQEALRSKGVFKIAPPSKVQVKPKDKKPLTAKQKLLAKMRR